MMKQVLVLGFLVAAMSPLSVRADAVVDCLDTWDKYLACHEEMTVGSPTVSCEKRRKGGFGIFITDKNLGTGSSTAFIDLGPDQCGVGIGGFIGDIPQRCASNPVLIDFTKKQRAQLKKDLKAICTDIL